MGKNTSYINSGNFLSKSLFLKKEITPPAPLYEGKILLITETNKELENYSKIFDFLNINFRNINNYEVLNYLQRDKALCGQYIYLSSIETLENIKHKKSQLEHFSITLNKNESYDFNNLTKKLISLGYKFSEYKNPATFSRNGDIFNIFSSDGKIKYEISFWGDTIEEIRVLSPLLREMSDRTEGVIIEQINIGKNEVICGSSPLKKGIIGESNLDLFFEIINKNIYVILDNLNFSKYYDDLIGKLENFSCFDYIPNKQLEIIDLEISVPKIENTGELKEMLAPPLTPPLQDGNNKKSSLLGGDLEGGNSIIYTKNTKVIENFLEYNNIQNVKVVETKLNNLKSFTHPQPLPSKEGGNVVICDDILSKIFTRKRLKKNLSADLDLLLKIKPGDYVVHIEHGIGIFKNIIKRELPVGHNPTSPKGRGVITKEYIEIEYAGEDKLFVPITEVSRVNKYLGVENPKLTGLGGVAWEKKLQKAKKEAEEVAQELIEIYANRKLQKGFSFRPHIEKENNFRESFSYNHTIDQQTTIAEILEDMEKENPMDRLVVGDVGFGKTEIAFNAIYRAFINKKQSILIVPLVVLAYEHYEKAKERFKTFGLKIGILTRLETEKKTSETIRKLTSGELDLVIGTHKLLSDKIIYKDLGLIVTDEEHKFGVSDKEKIKEFKATIDSLAMSATPIPRSLNMALSNLRQISILKTPPFGRQDIETSINRFSDSIIETAGKLEFERNGQMFFVHNRVASIEGIARILKNIFPDKSIVITHGQLPGIELEKRIIAFKHKKYDILLSTTVIENGIDFSNVNTIIINNAEQFGLSQIHQLRGRVGRSDKKGYCHLLYKGENIKPDTAKRLKTIVEYSYVGAGFELAMKDLEIRGGGDLLGFRQSGQSSTIGINLYLKIIEEKIVELQALPLTPPLQDGDNKPPLLGGDLEGGTKIELDLDLFISDDYFNSELDKINFYREIELVKDLEELEEIKNSFIQNIVAEGFNPLIFDLLELKLISSKYFIKNIKKVGINYQLDFSPHPNPLPGKERELEILKKFLDLDKEVKFVVISKNRLRSSIKNFANNKIFIKYMLSLFKKENLNNKIKLKKKLT